MAEFYLPIWLDLPARSACASDADSAGNAGNRDNGHKEDEQGAGRSQRRFNRTKWKKLIHTSNKRSSFAAHSRARRRPAGRPVSAPTCFVGRLSNEIEGIYQSEAGGRAQLSRPRRSAKMSTKLAVTNGSRSAPGQLGAPNLIGNSTLFRAERVHASAHTDRQAGRLAGWQTHAAA